MLQIVFWTILKPQVLLHIEDLVDKQPKKQGNNQGAKNSY